MVPSSEADDLESGRRWATLEQERLEPNIYIYIYIYFSQGVLLTLCSQKCVFRKYVLPQNKLAKELPKLTPIPKCLDLTGYIMVVLIATCKFDAKNTTDAFKHVPALF